MTIVDVVTVSVCVLVGNEGKGPIRRPTTGSTMNQRKNRKRNKTVRRKKKDKRLGFLERKSKAMR